MFVSRRSSACRRKEWIVLAVGSHGKPNEVFINKSCTPSHLSISASKGICKSLYLNTGYYEVIQSHSLGLLIILQQHVLDKGGAEPVSHLSQSLCELSLLNKPASVLVNGFKHPLPLVDVREESPELLDVDGPRLVLVEHVDHHPARLLAEVAPVPIDQSSLQFLGVYLTTSVCVNCLKPLGDLRVDLN